MERGWCRLKTGFVVVIACCLSVSVMASDTYLCRGEVATGFAFDKKRKEWYSASFKTLEKYLVSRNRTMPGPPWEVKEFGSNRAIASCRDDFSEGGELSCEMKGHKFYMDRNGLRYLLAFPDGYWNHVPGDPEEGSNTPYLEIGTCRPLQP